MVLQYSISLWNYGHYSKKTDLPELLAHITDLGYGVEAWWRSSRQIVELAEAGTLSDVMKGMPITLHTGKPNNFEEHVRQIEDAAKIDARTIVLHPSDLARADNPDEVDVELTAEVVQYAARNNIHMALENGKLTFLKSAIDAVDELKICLDVGHVYNQGGEMRDYLNTLKHRLHHLHLQDIARADENGLPLIGMDHYTPGTGGIPREDWLLIADTMKEIDFHGLCVFEIRPRNPFQTAREGQRYFTGLFEASSQA